MEMKQKTVCIIHCDKTTLPILDYIDNQSLVALSLSRGVIIWVYKGLAMIIPPERVANMASLIEDINKQNLKNIKPPKMTFNSLDTIKLPSKIARALLGDDK